jgi:hypothetical protein
VTTTEFIPCTKSIILDKENNQLGEQWNRRPDPVLFGHRQLSPALVMPRRKIGATQATQNAGEEGEDFGDDRMDLDDAGDDVPARKQKGATGRRGGATTSASLSAEVSFKVIDHDGN